MKDRIELAVSIIIALLLLLLVVFVSFQLGRIHGHKEARWYVETGELPEFSPVKDIWNY